MLDQLYNDFTTKLLPKVQEGLEITKDYFTDLFARYIKYLIISDSISIALTFLLTISSVIAFIILWKKTEDIDNEWDDRTFARAIWGVFCGIAFIFSSVGMYYAIDNLIKDLYIPEVRILEIINERV